jgi:carbonic anhydrase
VSEAIRTSFERLPHAAQEVLVDLLEGNRRFREGDGEAFAYDSEEIAALADAPRPKVAVVACSDSRVSPEIVFNQPLGKLFISRVPGNVASDGSKWMIDIAVSVLRVPLVVVMGHTDCLAVKQVVGGETSGSGGALRYAVSTAVLRARDKQGDDLFRRSVIENARLSAEQLAAESWALQRAMEKGATSIVTGLYEVETGTFSLID